MRFKLSAILIIAVGALVIVGCGLKLDEKAPPPSELKLDSKKYSCVGQIASKAEEYVEDNLSESDINEFAKCLQEAFIAFDRYTHGSGGDTYRPEEISNFIQDKFLKGKVISPSLLKEIMVLKQVFIGGRVDRISRKDLRSVISLIEEFRVEAIRMKPHIKVLNLGLLKTQGPEGLGVRLRQAQVALNQSIQNLTGRLLAGGSTYSFLNLEKFLIEFRLFTDWKTHFPETRSEANWISFLKIFKELTASSYQQGMAATDWAPVLNSLGAWYMLILQFEVGVRPHSFYAGAGFENLKYLVDEAFGLIEQSIRRQTDLVIRYEQLDRLNSAIHGLGWFPKKLRVESVNKLSRILFNRMLGSSAILPRNRKELGLNEFNLSHLRAEFYRWVGIQKNIIAKFSQPEPEVDKMGSIVFSDRMPRPVDEIFPKIQFADSADWTEFLEVEKLMRPLYREGGSHIFVTYESRLKSFGLTHGFQNLSVMNLTRALMNLFVKGYTSEAAPSWSSVFTEDQLQEFYMDIRDFGVDIGILDQRSQTAGRRAFLEGSIFTYAAKGIVLNEQNVSTMKMDSGVQLLTFLHSGGKLATEIYDELAQVCLKGPEDLNAIETLSRTCVLDNLAQVLVEKIHFMPELKRYLENLSEQDLAFYSKTLLETAYSPQNSKKDWVEYAEFSTVAVVVHYAEAVMSRYDTNEDGLLDESEVDNAAETFSGLIAKVAVSLEMGDLYHWQKVAALKYILAFKEIPNSFGSKFWLFMRSWTYWGFGLEVNRLELSQVFRAIIQKIVEPKMAQPAVPPKKKRGQCFRCGAYKFSF